MVFSASLEGTFVFEVVALIRAGFRVDVIDGFAFLEEHAFDADVRFQLHNVVINEAPFANGLSVLGLLSESASYPLFNPDISPALR